MRFSMIKLMTLAIMQSCSLSSFGQQSAVWNTEHYRERMAEFAKMRSIDATDIVMLGNSLTEFGGDWSKRLGLKHVRNRGIAGDNVDGVLNRLDAILSKKPKAILLMIGINDISQDQTAEQIFEKYQRLIDRIWAQAADTKLYVQSVLPINESFGRWKTLEGKTDVVPILNVKLRHYCERNHIAYINLFKDFIYHGTNEMRRPLTSDGLHLTSLGYKLWAFRIKKVLNKN